MFSDEVCFNCKYMEFKKDYSYPFRCKKNKSKAYKTMSALMIDNGIDFENLNASCSNFKKEKDDDYII